MVGAKETDFASLTAFRADRQIAPGVAAKPPLLPGPRARFTDGERSGLEMAGAS
jgi:hypothetical protein